MADQKYTATLTGKGTINNAFIYLETLPSSPKLAVPILLYPKPGQKKVWTNAKISLAVHGSLDYELQVNAAMGTDPQFNPALGLYLSQDGSPLDIVAGLQVQTLDWFNTSESDKSRGARTIFDAVASYVF